MLLYDRRRAKRVPVRLEVRWRGDSGVGVGELSDISTGGCFVLTCGQATARELVKVEIAMPFGGILSTWGVVVEHCPEIGFSLRFTALGDADLAHVEQLIATISAYREAAADPKTIVEQTTTVEL